MSADGANFRQSLPTSPRGRIATGVRRKWAKKRGRIPAPQGALLNAWLPEYEQGRCQVLKSFEKQAAI
jgi:hypothetical protein